MGVRIQNYFSWFGKNPLKFYFLKMQLFSKLDIMI